MSGAPATTAGTPDAVLRLCEIDRGALARHDVAAERDLEHALVLEAEAAGDRLFLEIWSEELAFHAARLPGPIGTEPGGSDDL